jgi:hypothetical protein
MVTVTQTKGGIRQKSGGKNNERKNTIPMAKIIKPRVVKGCFKKVLILFIYLL